MRENFEKAAYEASQRAQDMCDEHDPPIDRAEVLDRAQLETALAINSLQHGMSYLSKSPPQTSAAAAEFTDAAALSIRLATWVPYFRR